MFALLPALSIGQTSIYSCDFEDATENSEWLLLGGTFPNQWYIGSAVNNGGTNALYISNDNGVSNAYTVAAGTTQFVFAMRSLTLEVGEYVVGYDWKCNGQGNNDFMRVAIIPESIADSLDAAATIDGLRYNAMPAGWVVADGGNRLSGSSAWTNKQATASVIADGNYKLVFIWYNNKTGGTQPPAAIDNITIVRNNCMSPAGLTVSDIDVHEATLSWSGMAGSNYELRYSTVNDVTSATSYPNTDSTFTSAVLTDLAANTRYYAWVRVTCNDEWIAFPQFSTLLACAPVTGAHVESVDRNNALISWNFGTGAAYEPTGVVVTYGSAGSSQRTLTTTSNYIILTGLASATTYTASIRTVCDVDTAQAVTVSFTTAGCNYAVGDGTDSSYVIGPSDNYRYSTYEWIFRANELNMPAGYITSISLDCAKAPYSTYAAITPTYNFYMATTTQSSFSSSTGISASSFTHVATKTTHYTLGENVITFTTPFYYDGVSNLVIAFTQSMPGWSSPWDSGPWFRYTTTSFTSGYYHHNDDESEFANVATPTSGSSYHFGTKSDRPNIGFPMGCNDSSNCFAPMVIVDEVTTDAITVHWGDPQDSTRWRVEYRVAGSGNWTVFNPSVAEPYAVVTDLQANTNYEIRVGTICSGSSPAYTSIQARTLCDRYNFPYIESFNDAGSLNCWTLNGQSFNSSYGSGCLISYHAGARYAVLPEIETVYESLQFNFDMRSSSTSSYVILGVVSDIEDPDGSFTAISDTVHNSTTGTFQTFELPVNYYGPDGRLALKIYSGSNNVYIDNVHLMYPPTCFKIDNVTVSGITTTYATVQWTDSVNSYPMGYAVQVGDTMYVTYDSPLTVTGLDSNTTYTVRVRAICDNGDTAEYSDPVSFRTLRAMPATVPYTENFENPATYAGWEMQNGSYTNKWCIGSATNNGGTHAMYVSNNNGTANTYSTNSTSYVFATREFQLEPGNYYLNYDWKCEGELTGSTVYDFMRVALVPTTLTLNGSDWTSSLLPLEAIALDGNGPLYQESTWQSAEYNFDLWTAGNYNLVFYWENDGSSGSNPPAAIDNIRFVLNTCPAPVGLQVGAVTATSAYITWLPLGAETQWLVSNGIVTDTAYTASYTFDSLEPSTTYTFTVVAYCAVDDQSYAISTTGTTLCAPVDSLPYLYGFEDASSTGSAASINMCYDRLNNTVSNYPYPSSTSRSGQRGLYFYGSSSQSQYSCLVLPEMTTPVDSLELSFFARLASSSDNVMIRVGVISDPSDYRTFNEVDYFIPQTTQFEEYIVDFNNYTGYNGRIAIAIISNQGSGYLYLDDITVDRIPACPKVRNVAVTDITTTSAKVTWLDNGFADAWFVDYSPQPFTGSNNNYMSRVSTTPSVNITGLDSNQTYYIRVKANCGTDVSIYSYVEFNTLPYMPTMLPFNDGFENSQTYAGWVTRQSTGSNPNRWYIGSAASNGGSKALYISSDGGYTNDYNANSTSTDYAFREFYFEAGRSTVSFDWRAYGESTYDYLRVFLAPASLDLDGVSISTSGVPSGCIAVDGGSKLNLSNTWQTGGSRVDIATAGIYRLVFYWRNDNSGGTNPPAAIDNVRVQPSNCPAPTGLTAVTGDNNEVILTWNRTTNATSWVVSNGSSVRSINDTTCTFTNLTPRTTYLFNVRAVCSSIDTSTVATIDFSTPCAVIGINDLPLVEDFEDYVASSTADIDPCWVRYQTGNTFYPAVNSFYHYSGDKSLNFPGIHNCYVALPEINVDLARLQLTFFTRSLNNDGVNVEVGVMSDPTDTSTFRLVTTIVSDTVWRPATVYFNAYTGPAGRIAIRGNHLGAYVDSLVVDIATGCPVPININVVEPGDTSVVIEWSGNSDSYRVQYRPQGSPNWLDLGTFTSTTATISGLLPISNYEVRVSGICNGQQGDWSLVATITTIEAANGCNPVQNLAMFDIGSTAARVAWNYSDTVVGVRFELRYGAAGFDIDNGSYVDTIVSSRTHIIEGLASLTAYDIYCRAVCADGYRSLWAGPAVFTTIGIDAVGFDAHVALYPNPANGRVTVSVEGATGQVRIEIVDLNGRTVVADGMNASEGSRQLDISNLAKGAYFVRIYGDGVNSVRKLIVK